MEETRKLLVEKMTNVEGVEELKRGVIDFLKEKFVQLLHLLDDFGRFFTEKVDQLLPPATRAETLNRWLHVGLTVVLPVALSLLFLYYCCRCCCRGGGAAGRAAGRMMKAPGRGGRLMPRASFEGNPQSYFRDLHAGKDLVY
ncbi:uncharacterized protein [Elaeis guineensis]|uniref:Uncharacterized protein LOC105056064 n=1 Tax=Elaeis guineensis var. tenera TaxID=51953 RepID=A0A6I9S203_ELAGV|nr:uncharacterized protein LOC105056064 [Elaeis guineensis]